MLKCKHFREQPFARLANYKQLRRYIAGGGTLRFPRWCPAPWRALIQRMTHVDEQQRATSDDVLRELDAMVAHDALDDLDGASAGAESPIVASVVEEQADS